jgi:hypothetical protein
VPGDWIDGDDKGFLVFAVLAGAFFVGDVKAFVGEVALTPPEVGSLTLFNADFGRDGGPMTLSILVVRDRLPVGDGDGEI